MTAYENAPIHRSRRAQRRKKQSDWNLLIRACALAISLGITLILIIMAMPTAPKHEAIKPPTRTLKWVAHPDTKAIGSELKAATEVTGEFPNDLLSKQVPEFGTGKTKVIKGTNPGNGKGHVYYYRVEVEDGIPIKPEVAAQSIHQILNDPRGWGGPNGEISFTRTDGQADFRIVIASPRLTDQLCAPLTTNGLSNCRNGNNVVLNARRWMLGAQMWFLLGKTLTDYRIYEVSHETGHWLGHGHVTCPASGALAPTMMQQSNDGGNNRGCIPNGWPNPDAKKHAKKK